MTEFLTHWHASFMDTGRIPPILMAMLLCVVMGMITGPLAGNANPLFWRVLDVIFGNFGEKLDRKSRARADLMFRGFLIAALVIFIAALLGKASTGLIGVGPAYGLTEIVLLSALMSVGSIWFVLLKLYFAMEHNKVGEGAYYAIARSSRVNLNAGDEFGITRVAMGLSARSFDKAMIAPALWFLIGGFPLAFVYSALAMLSWRFGRNGLGSSFADVPLALEKLMGIIPSLFSAAFITLAAGITPTAKMHKGVAAWIGHKNRAPYNQGGAPLSALSWALNVSLGGAVQDISGTALKGEWVGPEGATAQLDHKHLRRTIYINVIAHLLFVAALLGAYTWGDLDLTTFPLDF